MKCKLLLLPILTLLFNSNIYGQKLYVISVGIADYKEISDLLYTENDVSTFNNIMSKYGAEITSLLGKEATHTNIIHKIRSVSARAKAEDSVIFFFSGHGYEGGFCCYDMRANSFLGGIAYQEIQILLRNCRAGRKVVIADACFSGGLSKQRTALTVQAVQKSNLLFFLSSQFDETSIELPNGPNGLFTYVLEAGLNGSADSNGDNKITYQEIYNFVYENVSNFTNQISHNQHPKIWGRFDPSTTFVNLNRNMQ